MVWSSWANMSQNNSALPGLMPELKWKQMRLVSANRPSYRGNSPHAHLCQLYTVQGRAKIELLTPANELKLILWKQKKYEIRNSKIWSPRHLAALKVLMRFKLSILSCVYTKPHVAIKNYLCDERIHSLTIRLMHHPVHWLYYIPNVIINLFIDDAALPSSWNCASPIYYKVL